jgi:uncharacterized Fe-S cluster protein YjdI
MSKVSWDENTCQHAGNCVKGLPDVFKIENGAFVINKDAASVDEIKAVIEQCPSGALKLND